MSLVPETHSGRPERTSPVKKASADASPRLLTLAEAAKVLGLSLASIRRLIWAGTLPAVRLTRRILIDIRDLDRLIERAKDHETC